MGWYTNKVQGVVGTVTVHLVFIVILLLGSIAASLPSSENEGLQINFGNSLDGSGSIEPQVNYDNDVVISLPTRSKNEKVEEKKILTQDHDDSAPAIVTKKTTPKKETKKTVVKEKTEETKKVQQEETKETQTEKPREVNKKALFPGKKVDGGTGGEGETGKEGNQGALEGNPDSKNRTGGATGGNGIGEGDGKGISFDLGGRNASSLPKPDYLKQKQGIVVVQVTVDRQGKVTKAVPGFKGSTTLDADLLKAAEKAALTAKFDVSQNAPAYQTGTITYIFKLQ